MLAGLHSLVRFAAEDGYVEWTLAVPNEPEPPRQMPAASPEAVLAVIAEAGGSERFALRNKSLLLLMETLGLRPSEVVALDVRDVNKGHRSVVVRRKQARLSSCFRIPLAAHFARGARRGDRRLALCSWRTAQRLDRVDCSRILKKLQDRSGVRGVVSPRRLRNSAARLALKASNNDVARVAALVGQDARHTARYLKQENPGDLPALIAEQLFCAKG